MKKKINKLMLIVLLLVGFVYSGYYLIETYQNIQSVYSEIGTLKDLKLETLEREEYILKSKSDKKRFLVKFSTGCEHCNQEMIQLKELRDILLNYEVYMLSYNSIETIKQFKIEHEVESNSLFHFYHDKGTELAFFQNKIIPAIYIYNEEGELEYFNEGVIEAKALRNILENNLLD